MVVLWLGFHESDREDTRNCHEAMLTILDQITHLSTNECHDGDATQLVLTCCQQVWYLIVIMAQVVSGCRFSAVVCYAV